MRTRIAAGLIAGLLGLAGCGGTTPAAGHTTAAKAPVSLNVGYPAPSGTFLPWFVAIQQGIFKKNGLKVSMKRLAGSATETPALLSGGVQAVIIDSNSALTTTAKGAKVALVGNTFNGYAFELWAKPGLNSLKALKGHTLGLEHVASLSASGAHALFAKFGVPFSSVKAEYLGSDQTAVAALIDGKVDSAITAPPAVFEAQAKGFHLIYNLATLPHVANAIEVKRSFVRQHPAEVTALLKSYIEAVAYLRNPANKTAAGKALTGYTKISNASLVSKTYGYFAKRLLCNPMILPSQLSDAVQYVKQHAHKSIKASAALDLAPLQALEKSGFVKKTCAS